MTHKGFLAAFQVSMLFMKFCIDGTPAGFGSLLKMTICHVRGWHKYAIKKDGNLLPLLLQVTLASPTICNCRLFHIFGLSMLPSVVNKTAVTRALNIGKKTRCLNEVAKHRNQVCKTRHSEKLASFRLVQLAPRSFCHAVDGIWEQRRKFNFSRGELRKTSSRSAAPSALLVSLPKHLECSRQGGGDKQPLREDGKSKKVRLCHLSPNPPKTSPLWGVGHIIIQMAQNAKYLINLKNLSMMSITRCDKQWNPEIPHTVEWREATAPNEQDPRYKEDWSRAKYSRKITADFLWGKWPVEFTPDLPKKLPKSPRIHTLAYKVTSNLKKSRSLSSSFLLLLNFPIYMFLTARSPFRKKNNKYHRNPLNHRTPELEKGWIHRWPFVMVHTR